MPVLLWFLLAQPKLRPPMSSGQDNKSWLLLRALDVPGPHSFLHLDSPPAACCEPVTER